MRHLCRVVIACVSLITPGLAAGQSSITSPPSPASPAYSFESGAGLLVFHVRLDRTRDFESVMSRLSEVLATTTNPTRQQQASSWRMFRSVEPPKDVSLYVFFFDPAVSGADYDPVRVLSEAAPAEAQAYYERLRAAVVKVERMGLARVR